MENKLLLDNTHAFIYKKCSKNVKIKIAGHSNADIYPTRYKMLSNICNCKITSDNPYLMTDGALNAIVEYFDYYGNKKKKCSKQEILFCKEQNIDSYCIGLFTNLIKDLLLAKNNIVEQSLCEYIPLAENTAYKSLISQYSLTINSYEKYGIPKSLPNENDVINKAILYLYFSNNDIDEVCKAFIKETTSFKKLDTKIETFINEKFIPNLRQYNDTHFDGIITKQIIELRLGKIISLLVGDPTHTDCKLEQSHYYTFFSKDLEYIHARAELQKRLIR